VARRHDHDDDVGRGEGRAEPEAGLGISPIRRPAEAAGRLREQAVLRPTNPEAFNHIPPEVSRQLPTYPENVKLAIKPDTLAEADQTAKIQERFTQWLAS
jgi:hypothetical protein